MNIIENSLRRIEKAGWNTWVVTMKHAGHEEEIALDAKSKAHAIELVKNALAKGVFKNGKYQGNTFPSIWIRQFEDARKERERLETEIENGRFLISAIEGEEGPYFKWHK